MPSPKKRVAVVGATGIAGQQFLAALDRHPWFDVVKLAASERSAGKTYAAAIRDAKTGAQRWWCAEPPPPAVMHLTVENGDGLDLRGLATRSCGASRRWGPRNVPRLPCGR